jgi:hypothetical protein
MVEVDASRKARDEKVDALHEQLIAAVEQLVTSADWARALEFAVRFRSRSFNNTLLICVQHLEAYREGRVPGPVPTYVAGFKQWQQLGRQVGKGQSGYMIFAPVTARFASSSPTDSESWRRLGKTERPRPGEVLRTRMVGVRQAHVWDVSQTSGEPIPEQPVPVLLHGEAPPRLWHGLAALVRQAGFTLSLVSDAGAIAGGNGLTDFRAKTVQVRRDMDPAARCKTLIHEVAHVLMHGSAGTDARAHQGVVEVEAESVALMVGAAHGMDTRCYTIPYVSGWATSVPGLSPVEVVQRAGERVRTTAVKILDALPTAQIGTGGPPGPVMAPPGVGAAVGVADRATMPSRNDRSSARCLA